MVAMEGGEMLPVVKDKRRSKDSVWAKGTQRNFKPSESAKQALMLIVALGCSVQYLFSWAMF